MSSNELLCLSTVFKATLLSAYLTIEFGTTIDYYQATICVVDEPFEFVHHNYRPLTIILIFTEYLLNWHYFYVGRDSYCEKKANSDGSYETRC